MRTILITGSSRGIGRAIALGLTDMDLRFAIHYKEQQAMAEEVVAQIRRAGRDARAYQADVRSTEEVNAMFDAIEKDFGTVDILINNAGVGYRDLFTEMPEEHWLETMDTNINGMYRCARRAVPAMVSNKRGDIIQMASIWGLVGGALEVHYSASKGAAIAMTKALAKELGPSQVRVNAIAPGAIMTDMLTELGDEILACVKEETPLGLLGTPDHVVAAVRYLLGPGGEFVTGQVISPNGGFVI